MGADCDTDRCLVAAKVTDRENEAREILTCRDSILSTRGFENYVNNSICSISETYLQHWYFGIIMWSWNVLERISKLSQKYSRLIRVKAAYTHSLTKNARTL
jgi:hypothetical protein